MTSILVNSPRAVQRHHRLPGLQAIIEEIDRSGMFIILWTIRAPGTATTICSVN
jgi:hypothetical protein